MNPAALSLLHRRKDRLLGWGRRLLLAAFLILSAGMLLYTREIDVPAMGSVLVPDELLRARLLSGVTDLGFRRIWGGPMTRGGFGVTAMGFLVLGLIALAEARLAGRKLSKTGLLLVLASLPMFGMAVTEGQEIGGTAFLRPADAGTMRQLVEQRQPALAATLRRGGVADLPESGAVNRFGVGSDLHLFIPDAANVLPLQDRREAEAFRFVLAQQAVIAKDRTALRALLAYPIHLPDVDPRARRDVAQRLAAIETFAGKPAVDGRDRAWVDKGAAEWRLSLGFSRILRRLFQLLLVAGLLSLVTGLIIRRRLRRIGRHLEASDTGSSPAGANLHLTTAK
jgi:hypothetical protein